MNKIELDDNDVVSMLNSSIMGGSETCKVSQLIKWLARTVNSSSTPLWLGDGAECELLQPKSPNGWVKGKFRVRFEFIPDEPEEQTVTDAPGSLVKPE